MDSHATDRKLEPRRYWQIPTFLAGIGLLYAAYLFVPIRSGASQVATADGLDELRYALEQPSIDAAAIEPIMRKLESENPADTPTNFLLGSAYVALAELVPGENIDYWHAAAKAFERCDADCLGQSPDAQKFQFRFAMAKAATRTGSPAELIPVLMSPPAGENRSERLRLIAESALRLSPPDRNVAKEFLATYLGGQNRRSKSSIAKCKLELARLHLADRETEKARSWLKDIGTAAPPEVASQARVQLGQIAMAEEKWPDAAAHFEAALDSPGLPSEERNSIRYLRGLALSRGGNDGAAVQVLIPVAKEPGALGGAAAMKLAEIRNRQAGTRSRSEAADWLEKAVVQAGANDDRLNASELRATFEDVIKASSAGGDFDTALRAATAYAKVAEGDADRKHRAEIAARWADSLSRTNPTAAQGKYRDSGSEYAVLAERTPVPVTRAEFWRKAAIQYRRAGDPETASRFVATILGMKDLPDELLGQAWVDHADLLPVDRADEIELALKKAVALPGPAAMSARYKLGVNYVKRGQETAAKALVNAEKREAEQMTKLGRDMLAQLADASVVLPLDQPIHELALFELGRLAMLDRQYLEAESRLRKQLTLYPDGEQSDNARLWMASALLARAQSNPAIATKIRSEAQVYLKELTKSNDPFLQTWGEIWQANTLLQMGETDATIALCKSLMVKHNDKLEELVLGKLLFHAYITAKSSDPVQAQKTLTRMEELFAKLPREAFRSDAEYSYNHWKTELPRLRELLVK